MIALLIAAAAAAAPSEADVFKAVGIYTVCRDRPFPQAQRDDASIEAAKAAYVRKHGGTAEARKEIDVACVLYRLAYEDGGRRAHEVERALSPEVKGAIEREIIRQFGPVEASPPSNK